LGETGVNEDGSYEHEKNNPVQKVKNASIYLNCSNHYNILFSAANFIFISLFPV